MDTITHSLLGAVVARAVFPARDSGAGPGNRQRMLAGALAGAFPDIDYVMSWVDPMVYLTHWHRGITHSFIMLPLWALLVGGLLALLLRRRDAWRLLSLLAGAAIASHILSDLITVYGTQILAPLSGWRASFGTTFIIDPWFSLIVLAGFIAGLRQRTTYLPALSLVLLTGYVGFQAVLRQEALEIARQHVRQQGLAGAQVDALPQPLSPYNWKLIISRGDRYQTSYINLDGGYARSDGDGFIARIKQTYLVPQQAAWRRWYRYGSDAAAAGQVRDLWYDSQLDLFRRFAGYPVLYRIDTDNGRHCVWFTDLRYVLPYMTPPFRYGLCRGTGSRDWQLERLRRRAHTPAS